MWGKGGRYSGSTRDRWGVAKVGREGDGEVTGVGRDSWIEKGGW